MQEEGKENSLDFCGEKKKAKGKRKVLFTREETVIGLKNWYVLILLYFLLLQRKIGCSKLTLLLVGCRSFLGGWDGDV